MASNSIPYLCSYRSNSNPTATSSFSPRLFRSIHLPPTAAGSRRSRFPAGSFLTLARFEKSDRTDVPNVGDDSDDPASLGTTQQLAVSQEKSEEEEEQDQDSDLPSDLEDAIRQSSQASALFISSGGTRAIVELLIPQLQFLDAEGAQGELWGLSRVFLETLMQESGIQRLKAIFPDAGAAALLQYQWKDAKFGFSSLSDRKPVANDDEVIVMIIPDYQMLEYVERIASQLSNVPPKPLIMWNPRLVSEDVGVGFNVRRLQRSFLSTFTTVYSMKPLPSGAVFRCYPGLWKVFYDDKARPNRYLLAKEQPNRPDATDIEIIFGDVAEKSDGPSLFVRAMSMFSSINRFMRAISK